MAILNRIQRLFRADIHAILDAAEEPEVLLKQAIREMQETLDLRTAELERRRSALGAAKALEAGQDAELESARADLELALREGAEELVRKTIARKLGCQKRVRILRQRVRRLEEECAARAAELEAQRAQLETVVEKAKTLTPFASEDSAASVAESILAWREEAGEGSGRVCVSEDEIELEWLRLRSEPSQGGES